MQFRNTEGMGNFSEDTELMRGRAKMWFEIMMPALYYHAEFRNRFQVLFKRPSLRSCAFLYACILVLILLSLSLPPIPLSQYFIYFNYYYFKLLLGILKLFLECPKLWGFLFVCFLSLLFPQGKHNGMLSSLS